MDEFGRWDYANPVRCLFGWGRLGELGGLVGDRTLLVTSAGTARRGLGARVRELLGDQLVLTFDQVESNPSIESAQTAVDALARTAPEAIVAIGGGSTIDFGKVLSVALARPTLSLRSALENPKVLDGVRPIELIAVPTTAGTGSEVTPYSTLWDPVARRKHSLASPLLFPKVALLDPELTLSLPWAATLSPGLDAYSQCFEAIWNRNATPITTALAQNGLLGVPGALRRLKVDLSDRAGRCRMLEASLLSGLAISRTRTALAHSISYPITAHFGLPHGLACALTLPAVLEFNLEQDDGRLGDVAQRAQCRDPAELLQQMAALFRDLGVPEAVREYVPDFGALYGLLPQMITPGRADNNLRAADLGDVERILRTTQSWFFGS